MLFCGTNIAPGAPSVSPHLTTSGCSGISAHDCLRTVRAVTPFEGAGDPASFFHFLKPFICLGGRQTALCRRAILAGGKGRPDGVLLCPPEADRRVQGDVGTALFASFDRMLR